MFNFIKRIFLSLFALIIPNISLCTETTINEISLQAIKAPYVNHEYLDVALYNNNPEIIVNGIKRTQDNTFIKIENVVIPDTIDGYPVTRIAKFAFACYSNDLSFIKSVKIGDNVRIIDEGAFENSSIESIEFGENVEILGRNAFDCCYYLNEIVLNDNLREIHGCSLAIGDPYGNYVPKMPIYVEYIDSYCFGGTRRRETFIIPSKVSYWGGNVVIAKELVVLSNDFILGSGEFINTDCIIYCYENSTTHELLKSGEITNEYHLIENAYLTSESVNVGDDFTVSGLPQGLTEETIGNYLNIEGNAYIRTSDETVKTGTKIELVNESPEFVYKTYTACIDGDINGDGSVNTTDDINAIRKIITGNDSAFSEAHKKAADLNGDGLVNSTDLVLMKSMQN